MDKLLKYIPTVTKRSLVFLFALSWMLTSFFMIFNSLVNLFNDNYKLILRLAVCVPSGLLIYKFFFKKYVTIRYLDRIVNLEEQKPFIFSFMTPRAYLLFVVMATLSFLVEIYKWIALDYLFTFQTIMSIPILITSLFFFRCWYRYDDISAHPFSTE